MFTIKIKVYTFFVLSVAFIAFTSCKQEETAKDIILKSVEYHGGVDAWEGIARIDYTKQTELFKANGKLELANSITYAFEFNPHPNKQMTWALDSINYQVEQAQDGTITANFVLNDSLQAKYKTDFNAAEFVYWQPYKLLEVEPLWNYIGTDVLEDGTPVKVIQIDYINANGSPGNTWWFYFNAESYRLEGNMVHHGTTYSYIRNTKYDTSIGLNLNAERISYRCDSLRNILFVRAKYKYTVLDIQKK